MTPVFQDQARDALKIARVASDQDGAVLQDSGGDPQVGFSDVELRGLQLLVAKDRTLS